MPGAKSVLLLLLCAACTSESTTSTIRRNQDAGPVGDFCAEACITNSDCLSGYRCEGRRCVTDTVEVECFNNLECIARLSGWSEGCQEDTACPAGFACVGTFNRGYCAPRRTEANMCTGTVPDELTLTRREGGEDALVCGNGRAKCNVRGVCFVGCRDNADCGGEYPICNASTGVCECSQGSCSTNASVCVSGRCECASDDDCTVASDTCFDGQCGCSAISVCPVATVHPNTQWVCE